MPDADEDTFEIPPLHEAYFENARLCLPDIGLPLRGGLLCGFA